MAFNFNWSPLTADAEFYQRARDLLTTALNKSPRPPIIVDDILVTEFNLGSVPPELEILEIGDLGHDRFRGIFKMCYSGDAFLTLRTRVQANPLNTYLSAKPIFTSPQPLAAASGLTIPLSITLSEIKLSGFVIVVFSKQKGLTLVFRNDPLESIKVSSTFDSIQFVRDYLQRTIESQLRNLMMDELPAIIHKLSLRIWCPDQLPREDINPPKEKAGDEVAVDIFATAPHDAMDANGHVLDAAELSSLSLESGSEMHSLFSQKNILRLAALNESHRTLSLFTPGIKDVLFRAWAGPLERFDAGRSTPHVMPSLVRTQSNQGSSTTYTFTDSGSIENGQLPSRPSFSSLTSATTGLTLGSGRHPRTRKKKMRVVNLRHLKKGTASETVSEIGDTSSDSASVAGPSSEPIMPTSIPEEPDADTIEPGVPLPNSPSKVRFDSATDQQLPSHAPMAVTPEIRTTPITNSPSPAKEKATDSSAYWQSKALEAGFAPAHSRIPFNLEKKRASGSDTSSVILEQAWINKMASEIARRVYDEKRRNNDFWAERDPPPAYEEAQ